MKKFLAIGMVTAIVAFAFMYGCSKNPVGGTGNAPSAPTLSSPYNGMTNLSLTQTVIWDTASAARSYHLQIATDSTFLSLIVNDSTLTIDSIIVESVLANSTKYFWRVNARNTNGVSKWSNIWSFTTIVAAPQTPVLNSPVNGALGLALTDTLTWSTVNGATCYDVQVSTSSTFATISLEDSTLTSASKIISGLASNTTYYWRVQEKNAVGVSVFANAWNFSTRGIVTDVDGNMYQTEKIGTQVWTVENLRTTKYNDGTAIPFDSSTTLWVNNLNINTQPAYCYYNNTTNPDSIKKWGALYNWNTVKTGKLAPAGWHVPTDSEWEVMQSYLVMHGYNYDGTTDTTNNKIAIALAAQTDWYAYTGVGFPGNNLTKNNSSGFSAIPGGVCVPGFEYIGDQGYWWSATEFSASASASFATSTAAALVGAASTRI